MDSNTAAKAVIEIIKKEIDRLETQIHEMSEDEIVDCNKKTGLLEDYIQALENMQTENEDNRICSEPFRIGVNWEQAIIKNRNDVKKSRHKG